MIKVVTAKQMQEIEARSIAEGASGSEYMLNAARGIAEHINADTLLLCGKGNNGGDAFAVGEILLEKGLRVRALVTAPIEECSKLCQLHWKQFVEKGGEVTTECAPFGQIVLDGLLGTGFEGELKGRLAEIVDRVNTFEQKKVAIDIPSGISGNTGLQGTHAFKADTTIYLGQPKIGFFLGKAFNYVGQLVGVSFGLEQKYVDQMESVGWLYSDDALAKMVPIPERVRHKYEAGYVVAVAGSPGMAGAAMLSAFAALRSGAGIVCLFFPKGMEEELVEAPLELVKASYEEPTPIIKEMERARCVLIGPGLGGGCREIVHAVLGHLKQSALIDADALRVLQGVNLKEIKHDLVLTPHEGELKALAGASGHQTAQNFADANKLTLVLKGAPTWIFTPGEAPVISIHGDPGMATAGSGDVLSGVIAALLAQGLTGKNAAILGTYLHARAGEIAAQNEGSLSVVASDILASIPAAFKSLKN